jgi:beta-fructofuranosidase
MFLSSIQAMFSRTILVGASLLSCVLAQTSANLVGTPTPTAASVYIETTVPTGTPIAGNYTGLLRPQVHYSPPINFMNDPNGMFVDDNGTWHLYYQCKLDTIARILLVLMYTDDATGTVAGNQHWGHATSQDLYHWINQPIALFPPNNFTYVFSGSAVVDVNNTSGFFPNQKNGV